MRARVNARLAAASRFAVTLISAPAGFGKSVALRDFLQSSRLDALRYDVGRDDRTLLAFVRRLSDVLEPVAPSARAAFPEIQRHVLASPDPVRAISDWFGEHLRRTVCTIVIDDLHYAAVDAASIALLVDLIERTSERIKWILAARSDVGIPVASWIAYGRMDLPVGEDDLRFTYDEALAAAEEVQSEIDPSEVEALLGLTDGWPVALAIALRTRTYAEDLRSATSGTRELVYRYLAEQVFSKLSEDERDFMLRSCVFPEFDGAIAEELGFSADAIERLRANATFLTAASPRAYRYHDLFRDFLETELRRRGEGPWLQALCSAAGLLRHRGDDARALQLYTKASDVESILDVLNQSGMRLFEQGQAETLWAALDMIPQELRQTNAAALGLSAMLAAARDRFESAERDFRAAIGLAESQDLRLALVHRYAIELVRQERDCVDFLKPYANDKALSATWRVPLLGTLATALVREKRIDEALSTIERAFESLAPEISDESRARLYQQAAYVHQFGDAPDRAKTYAQAAIEIALRRNLYDVAARAYSVLYWVIYEDDNPIAGLELLDRLSECARKGGSNQTRAFGLIAMYELEAELGDEAALNQLETALQETSATLPQSRAEALLPGQGMRAAWDGDFARACELLETAAEKVFGWRAASASSFGGGSVCICGRFDRAGGAGGA